MIHQTPGSQMENKWYGKKNLWSKFRLYFWLFSSKQFIRIILSWSPSPPSSCEGSRWSPWCRASRTRWSCCWRSPPCTPSSPDRSEPSERILMSGGCQWYNLLRLQSCQVSPTHHPGGNTELRHLLLVTVWLRLVTQLLRQQSHLHSQSNTIF